MKLCECSGSSSSHVQAWSLDLAMKIWDKNVTGSTALRATHLTTKLFKSHSFKSSYSINHSTCFDRYGHHQLLKLSFWWKILCFREVPSMHCVSHSDRSGFLLCSACSYGHLNWQRILKEKRLHTMPWKRLIWCRTDSSVINSLRQ
jgi:hypothetical protein